MIGELAYAYQLDSSGCTAFGDLRVTALSLWDFEVDLATTGPRRAAALRDRALLFWALAEDVGGRNANAWDAAAVAADQAAAFDPSDPDLARRADDARHNRHAAPPVVGRRPAPGAARHGRAERLVDDRL